MNKIGAGDLDRKVTIQRFTSVPNDEFNEPVETWADFKTVRAMRRDVSDRQRVEMMAAGQVGAFQVSRFTIRSTSETRTVTPVDRLVHDGKTWAIHGIKEADEGRYRFLEITAVKDAD